MYGIAWADNEASYLFQIAFDSVVSMDTKFY